MLNAVNYKINKSIYCCKKLFFFFMKLLSNNASTHFLSAVITYSAMRTTIGRSYGPLPIFTLYKSS